MRSRQVPKKYLRNNMFQISGDEMDKNDDGKKEHESETVEPAVCSICLEQMTKDTIRLNQCGHIFDRRCAVKWADKTRTCPLCRTRVKTFSTIDSGLAKPVRFGIDRFYVSTERDCGKPLYVGSFEENSERVRVVDGREVSTFVMTKSVVNDRLFLYRCDKPGTYYVRDSDGHMFEVPQLVGTMNGSYFL